MSVIIKILIDYNNKKYNILVESETDLIVFKTVLIEINSQLKQNISLKTHSFEIFDKDFGEYVSIIDENQLIEQLSRIRVTTNQQSLVVNGLDDNSGQLDLHDSGLSEQKSFCISDPSSGDDKWFINYFFGSNCHYLAETIGNQSEINGKIVEKVEELGAVGGSGHCVPKVVDKSKSEPINYLKISSIPIDSESYFYTYVLKYRNQSIIALKYKFDVFKAIKTMLDLITRNKLLPNEPFDYKWKTISEQMIGNGFRDWSPRLCSKRFFKTFKLYKKSLETCPDFGTASAINPLFGTFHSFDFKSMFSSIDSYRGLRRLRQSFDAKNLKSDQSMASSVSKTGKPPKFGLNVCKSDANLGQFSGKQRKMSEISAEEIRLFKSLCECMKIITENVGPVSVVKDFWDLVVNRMKVKGYTERFGAVYYNLFREYVSDYYALILINASDYTTAKNMFPLFEFIHSMNVKPYLSYSSYLRIESLRKQFKKSK